MSTWLHVSACFSELTSVAVTQDFFFFFELFGQCLFATKYAVAKFWFQFVDSDCLHCVLETGLAAMVKTTEHSGESTTNVDTLYHWEAALCTISCIGVFKSLLLQSCCYIAKTLPLCSQWPFSSLWCSILQTLLVLNLTYKLSFPLCGLFCYSIHPLI